MTRGFVHVPYGFQAGRDDNREDFVLRVLRRHPTPRQRKLPPPGSFHPSPLRAAQLLTPAKYLRRGRGGLAGFLMVLHL